MNDNLDYIELICEIKPDNRKNRDILIAFLFDSGFESFMETDKGVNAYIPKTEYEKNKRIVSVVGEEFKDRFDLKVSEKTIKNKNWNEEWTENYFEPIFFGNKLCVRASFHPESDAEEEIITDPKTAFGTGYHATTYMLIDEILNTDVRGKKVLDMGTGTGILAILSKKRGAGPTVAVDNDPKAVLNAEENIRINNTPDIIVETGTTADIKHEGFDIIYENIWKNTVISDMQRLYEILKNGGLLFVSGFYFSEYEDVRKAGENNGFKFVSVKEKDNWAMVKFLK